MIQGSSLQNEMKNSESLVVSPMDQIEEISTPGETENFIRTDEQVLSIKLSDDFANKLSEQNVDLNASKGASKPEVIGNQRTEPQNSALGLADSGQKAIALYDYQACKCPM